MEERPGVLQIGLGQRVRARPVTSLGDEKREHQGAHPSTTPKDREGDFEG